MRSTAPNSGCSANNASRNQQTNEAATATATAAAERQDFVEVPSLLSLLAAARRSAPPRSIQRGLPMPSSSRLNLSPLPLSNDDIDWSHAALSNSRRSGVRLPSIAGALERALVLSEFFEDDDGDNHGANMIELPSPIENNNQSQSQRRRRSGGCRHDRREGGKRGREGSMDNNDGGSALQ